MFSTRRRFATLVSGSLAAAAFARGLPALARGDDSAYRPPNVFISPHGRPFRAVDGAPYPVVDWFKTADRDGDGKIDRDEFVADASTFFDMLDLDGDGQLNSDEISIYEHTIAPEVLGLRVSVYASGQGRVQRLSAPQLWLAQYTPMEGPISSNSPDMSGIGEAGHGNVDQGAGVLPPDVHTNTPARPDPESELARLQGAIPYSLFADPEPVTAGDPGYLTNGVVRRAPFLAHARDNFARLDAAHAGFLTLAALPQSPVQRTLGTGRRS